MQEGGVPCLWNESFGNVRSGSVKLLIKIYVLQNLYNARIIINTKIWVCHLRFLSPMYKLSCSETLINIYNIKHVHKQVTSNNSNCIQLAECINMYKYDL